MQLSGALPKGENDGLTAMEGRLIKKPKGHIVALVILDAKKVETDIETNEKTAKLKIRRIESILPEDLEAAAQLIRRAYESRTGETTLPIELENDLKSALAGATLYEPTDETPAEPAAETAAEPVIDVPEGGYGSMTVPLLTALLRKRGLDATTGKKAELIDRLIANDEDPEASLPKANVTNLFSDGPKATEELVDAETVNEVDYFDPSAVADTNVSDIHGAESDTDDGEPVTGGWMSDEPDYRTGE